MKPSNINSLTVSAVQLHSSRVALAVVQLDSTGGIVSGGVGGGSTQVSIKDILTSSGGSVMDSTETAIKVNVVAGAAGGSTLQTVRQSTVGDLRAAVYQSTAADLNVTVAGYVAPSTTITVRQSTAADLNVTVAGYSTIVAVSSLAGAVTMRSSAANALVSVYQSTAADLDANVVQGSTVWQTQSRPLPAQAFTYGQITVNTTAALICAANANRTRLLVTNLGGAVAYLGASTVVSTSGHFLSSAAGYPVVFRHDDAVYGISPSTTIVSFVEETL